MACTALDVGRSLLVEFALKRCKGVKGREEGLPPFELDQLAVRLEQFLLGGRGGAARAGD